MIEGGFLEADAWVGEVFQEFDNFRNFGWVTLEVRDAVDVGVEVMDVGMFKVGLSGLAVRVSGVRAGKTGQGAPQICPKIRERLPCFLLLGCILKSVYLVSDDAISEHCVRCD